MTQVRLLLIAALLFWDVSWASAQFSFGTYFNYMRGTRQFELHMENAYGFAMQGMYRLPKTRLQIGLDLGMFCYDQQETPVVLMDMGNEGVSAVAEESNGFLTYSLVSRFDLNKASLINPYLEGRLGGISFYRSISYTDLVPVDPNETLEEEHPCIDEIDMLGTAFQPGLGGGFSLDLSRLKKEWNWFPVHVDLNAVYHFGTSGSYAVIHRDNPPPSPASGRTATTMSSPGTEMIRRGEERSPTSNLSMRLGVFILFSK